MIACQSCQGTRQGVGTWVNRAIARLQLPVAQCLPCVPVFLFQRTGKGHTIGKAATPHLRP
jgi:hypothetical protein